jgi:hypothetical protein
MDVAMVIAAWGEGVMCPLSPSPSSDRLSFAQNAKTRVKNWPGLPGGGGPGWGLPANTGLSREIYMFFDDGARWMGVSVVIAAWGEGVNVCLCPPSPQPDRSPCAQNTLANL